ncbi:MAG: substrate-binding domain-containing protein [Zoogloeaceae bacterium]|nr:substrate-binding domain-containing protein [Zoogloeaceae bacterium]
MNLKRYWFLTSLKTFILWPLWLNASLFLRTAEIGAEEWRLSLSAFSLLALSYVIYRFGRKARLPHTFLIRYGPFVVPLLFTLVVWLLVASVTEGDFSDEGNAKGLLFAFLPFFAFVLIGEEWRHFWLIPVACAVSYLFFMMCFALGTWRSGRFSTRRNKKALHALALVLVIFFTGAAQIYMQNQDVLRLDYDEPENHFDAHSEKIWRVSMGKRLSLRIDRDYPRLDGVLALIPVYAAAAEAIYRNSGESGAISREEAVGFSETTPAAYKALLDGRADIIFALAPSGEQMKEAAERGITFTLTPIAKEAFVFLVSEENPVESLSVKQIRAIYSGRIRDWQEVGGEPGKIMAFQRDEGSGSQTAMLQSVMRGTWMRKPFEIEYYSDELDTFYRIADYHNLDTAIGYSFRYHVTAMNSIPGVRLLAINHIEPTVENIRNGDYPLTETFYMVTARPLSENAQKLHNWFLSYEGQRLIERVGYVPVRNLSR